MTEHKLDSLRPGLERVRRRRPDSAETPAVDVDALEIVSLKLSGFSAGL